MPHARPGAVALATAALSTFAAAPAAAYNYVPTGNGELWGVQDVAAPRVDTGSIRDTTSNALTGFGGLRVRVSTDPPRNGELLRGFELTFNPPERFDAKRSVNLGGVAIARQIRFNRTSNWSRWLDTFKNVTGAPITVDASFGGQTGTGANPHVISETSSGDATVDGSDAWALSRFGATGTASTRAPSAVVFGSPSPFAGALAGTGNFLRSPLTDARTATGHESNFIGFNRSFTLQPGETRTMANFVVIGTAESAGGTGSTAIGAQITAVRNAASAIAAGPPASSPPAASFSFADLKKSEICRLVNWDVTSNAVRTPSFDPAADCANPAPAPMPPLAEPTPTSTGSRYDVVGKTIQDLRADLEAGRTTSVEITRAYLDRIAAYDRGPYGFNAYTTVASDALEQAKAADAKRAAGEKGALLGIPLAPKDLFNTKDMPTTNGSLAFEGFRPDTDATQVRLLREAGAVILGKASLEEYALSGHYSDSAYGIVWNAFKPSKSALASSGGTATAIAASLAAGGLGSQTGDSLYAPAAGASLYTLRGTDGIASLYGVMPLSWLQDFPGSMARSLPDLADLLNATTGTDPKDPVTVEADADAKRPADWRTSLRPDALQGKRIGFYDSAFVDPFATTETVDLQKAALQRFEDAGATLVRIATGPTLSSNPATGSLDFQGWAEYLKAHPEAPYDDPRQILASPKRLPYRRQVNGYTGNGAYSPASVAQYKQYRATRKNEVAAWMDSPPSPVDPDTGNPSPGPLDAVAFPGLRSTISLNDGNQNAFGRGDPPTNGAGAPSVTVPIGKNPQGDPIAIQLAGRAFSDAQLMGYAYAFDRLVQGHVETTEAPALPFKADPTPPVLETPKPVAPLPAPIPPTATPTPSSRLTARAAAARRVRRSTLIRRGLAVRVTINRPAVVTATLSLPRATAKTLRTSTRVGVAKRGLIRPGSATLRLRPSAKTEAALRRARRAVRMTLVVSAVGADGRKVRSTRTVTLVP